MSDQYVPQKTPFFYGWLIVAVATLVSFAEVVFYQPILGVFMRPLQEEFGWSRATIAGAISLGSLSGALPSPLVGAILDKWGGRWVIAVCGVVMAVCLFLLAGIHSVVTFYSFFVIGRGAMVSVMNLAASVTVSNWFVRNRGLATGIMNLGTRGGQAVLPALAAILIAQIGWRSTFVVLGFVVLVLAVLPALLVIRRRPEDVGLVPDGSSAVGEAAGWPPREVDWPARDAIRTRAFWLLTVATSISYMANLALFLHLIAYLQDRGLSTAVAVSVLSTVAIIGAIGGLVGGLAERLVSARWTFTISLIGQGLAMFLLVSVHDPLLAYGFAFSYGLVNGMIATLSNTIFAAYFGRQALGSIRGLASPIQLIFIAVGPFAGGLVYDSTGSYVLAFIGFGVLYIVGALCVLLARQPRLHPATRPQATLVGP